jgi:hypothetical protein
MFYIKFLELNTEHTSSRDKLTLAVSPRRRISEGNCTIDELPSLIMTQSPLCHESAFPESAMLVLRYYIGRSSVPGAHESCGT